MGGILSQLVAIKGQREQEAFNTQVNLYKTVFDRALQDPSSVQPGTLEAAANAIGMLADSQLGGSKGKGGKGGKGDKGGGIGDLFKGLLTMGAYNIHKQAGQQRERTEGAMEQARAGMPRIGLNEQERTELAARQAKAADDAKIATMQQTFKEKMAEDAQAHDVLMKRMEGRTDLTGLQKAEIEFGQSLTPEPRPLRPGARTEVQVVGPDGQKFVGYRGIDDNGAEQLYKLGSNTPLGPGYTSTGKPPTEGKYPAALTEAIDIEEILANPSKHTAAEVAGAQAEKKRQTEQAKQRETLIIGGGLRNEEARQALPGMGGAVTAPGAGQTPYQALNPKQKILVTNAENMLASGTSLGFGQAARNQINEAKRIVQEATGITPTEVDFRVERRKAAKGAFDKLTLLKDSTQGLFNSLDRAATILTNLRPQLPDSDLTKINEWLQSGAREFDTGLVNSQAAIQYGLALAAVRNEYARVIAGGAASVGQTPVEAIRLASDNMRAGFSSKNTKAMVDQIRTEGRQAIGGRQDELNRLNKEIRQPLFPELRGGKYEESQTEPPPSAGGGTGAPSHTATGPNGEKLGLVNGKWVPIK